MNVVTIHGSIPTWTNLMGPVRPFVRDLVGSLCDVVPIDGTIADIS